MNKLRRFVFASGASGLLFACGCSMTSSREPDLAPALQRTDPVCATPEPSSKLPKAVAPLEAPPVVKPVAATTEVSPTTRDRLKSPPEVTVTVLEPVPVKNLPAIK